MAYDNDPWGFEEEDKQKHESPNQTNYRHWEEQNERAKSRGERPIEYKPLPDTWWHDDELNH